MAEKQVGNNDSGRNAAAKKEKGKAAATKGSGESGAAVIDKDAVLAVVRVRGVHGVRWRTAAVLARLRLTRKNHCVLVKGTESARGMLKLAKDYITWGEASVETVSLLEKKGKQPFGLKPPVGGMEPIKNAFPKGALGNRGKAINDLIKKMS